MKKLSHVPYEHLVSGPGLLTLAQCLADIEGVTLAADTPKDVTDAALSGDEAICVRAVSMFSGLLGHVAGEAALAFAARGGVFICGGVVPQLGPLLDERLFRQRFENKGRMSAFISGIPTLLVAEPKAGLIGAASFRG